MMRYLCAVFCLVSAVVGSTSFVMGQKPGTDAMVQQVLSRMTIEEKVGQMTQVTIDVVSQGADGRQEPHALDMQKLRTAILDYHVGSILNVGPSGYTLDHWHEVISAIQDVATKETRLHIPVLYGIDAIHGVTYTLGGTLFPQAIGMAATWNTDLSRKEGEITAYEMRASGIPWNFYPVMDVGRQPLWSRLWETYGEDVYLASTMGKAYIEGHQGNDISAPTKGAVCLKHYVGYSFPITGKDRTAAWISERMLREYFLPPFEEGIKAGAPTVMINSSEVDGVPGHANYHLLTEVLRKEMDFQGIAVSDWNDIERLYTRDHVAASPKEAVRMAVMAGVDMSMVPLDFSFYTLLLECAKDRSVPIARIDEAVARILRVKIQLGLFDRPYPDKALKAGFASKEFTATNLQAAEESVTLLKNDRSMLPLARKAKILVTGPTANMLSPMNGGWTINWQGDAEGLYPKDKPTVLAAIQTKVGKENVVHVPGATFDKVLDIAAAVNAAKKADVAIVCLGEPAYCEVPGNIDDLTLNEAQLQLASEIIKTGKPVVLVLLEGRPRIIRPVVDGVRAILLGFRPGMEGGTAIADILFGDACPSGKLPVTYPRYPNDLALYDHKSLEEADGNRYNPQYPFGYGLSYTEFTYSDLKLDRATMRVRDTLHVSVTVENTGKVAGKEAVLLYLNDKVGSVSRPVRQIKGFTKVYLEPGQKKSVQFVVTAKDLSFIGQMNRRIVEPGGFRVMIEKLSADFTVE